ncbi:MAG: phosphoethanolamine transferase domain-containing protein, partial [Bacteroidales bacterium]|nr:phosphoethanolamine transferase domain-containing protein [Bacteroidales bacterium]
MKLDKRIIQWFSKQEHLFAVFVLLELIPNYILFFTEPYPITIRMASLMIPLGSFAILFSVFKRPGVMFWVLFIKFLLDAFQLVLLYLFGNSIIAVDMFLNLTTTNPTEAGELMSNIWIPVAGSLLLYVPAFFLATYSIKLQEILSKRFRLRSVAAGIVLFLGGWGIALIPVSNYHSFEFHEDIYPANIIYNQYFAFNKWYKTLNHAENARTFSFQATRISHSK